MGRPGKIKILYAVACKEVLQDVISSLSVWGLRE